MCLPLQYAESAVSWLFPQQFHVTKSAVWFCLYTVLFSGILRSAEYRLHLSIARHMVALTGLGGWALVPYQVKDILSLEVAANIHNISA